MEGLEIQTGPGERVIGLRHDEDPLDGGGRGKPAIEIVRSYLEIVAGYYRYDIKLLGKVEKYLDGKFSKGTGIALQIRQLAAVRNFVVVTLQQTFDGLPVWEHGITVHLKGKDNIVTGSSCSVSDKIAIEPIDEPPKERYKQAATQLRRFARKMVLGEFNVNRNRDFIYRYDAASRLPPAEPEPTEVNGGHFDHLLPELKLDVVPEEIVDGQYRYVTEVNFTTGSEKDGPLNWRALVDWEMGTVLCIRPLISEVTGSVFTNDPISLSGDPQLDPTALVPLLDAQRELVSLERLVLPGGGANTELTGDLVVVQDVGMPNTLPPTEPGGNAAVFDYTSDSDNFAAVCGYYTHDRLYQLMRNMGFDLPSYFDGASFPVIVDHRWGNTVNAFAMGNAMGDGIGHYVYSFAANGSQIGMATDPRVVAHEFGHGILWDHLWSPNFAFAHGLGDALAAILFDPSSQAPDRFRTFPFSNLILRRHDRSVASGWGWGGPMDVGSYISTQIVSTTIFRIYRALGGDDPSIEEREHASRYTAYLMLHAAPLLAGVVPNTPQGFAGAMQECDQGTVDFEGFAGGWAHKVVRWGFEKQDLYGGKPPKIDIFIADRRNGEYDHSNSIDDAPGIWNRHRPDGGSDHETPRKGVENYLYVRVANRGRLAADGVSVKVYRAITDKGIIWPGDWDQLGVELNASGQILPGRDLVVGPIPWCPQGCCEERILASATTKGDKSNTQTLSGSVPVKRLVLADNNVAMRKMEVNCPEDDRPCEDDTGKDLYRYAVKFVCGCSKGDVVAAGRYWTAINVRNSSDKPIKFRKRFSIALPNEQAGHISELSHNQLGAFEALEIDCEDIARHTKMPACCFIKGFAVIESKVELDVIVVYTAAKSDGEVETMDIEEVKPRRLTMTPPPPPPEEKQPDLIPVAPYPPGPPFFPSNYCHSPKELRIIVRNIGQGQAGPTTTRVEFFQKGVVVDLPTQALDPAGGANDEVVLSVQIPPGCLGAQPFDLSEPCAFRIIVNTDPADGVTETDITNNTDTSSCGIAL